MTENIAAASFRDPAGQLLISHDSAYRFIAQDGAECWDIYANNPVLARFRHEGSLIDYQPLNDADIAALSEKLLSDDTLHTAAKHKKITFPNYPYEWSAAMLKAAGDRTLDFAETLLSENILLKDATPFNIMFEGPNPVFLDALSFEKREEGHALWLAEAQFLRSFIFPLLAVSKANLPLSSVFQASREGLVSTQALSFLGSLERWKPRYLLSVTLPALIDKKAGQENWDKRSQNALEAKKRPEKQARFILEKLYARLRKLLNKAAPHNTSSHWSAYGARQHYTDDTTNLKRTFVEECLGACQPQQTLDIGCNLGEFTEIAAQYSSVVAIDSDPAVVGKLWHMAREKNLPILPLVQNIASPTPALGWNNSETTSFLDRAKGSFECVMMLAVIHHLLVTERIPLDQIITLIASITKGHLIIEYVGTSDPMFKTIARGREHLHRDLTEKALKPRFRKSLKS